MIRQNETSITPLPLTKVKIVDTSLVAECGGEVDGVVAQVAQVPDDQPTSYLIVLLKSHRALWVSGRRIATTTAAAFAEQLDDKDYVNSDGDFSEVDSSDW